MLGIIVAAPLRGGDVHHGYGEEELGGDSHPPITDSDDGESRWQ